MLVTLLGAGAQNDADLHLKTPAECQVLIGTCSYLCSSLRSRYFYLYFTGEETEAQGGEVTCPRSTSSK